jgi:hypothetical protein
VLVPVVEGVEGRLGLGLQPGHDLVVAGQDDDLGLHVQGIALGVGIPIGLVQAVTQPLAGLAELALDVRFRTPRSRTRARV